MTDIKWYKWHQMKSYNHRINWNHLDDRDDRCNLETVPCERIYRARRGSEWHKRMMYQPNAYSRAMSSKLKKHEETMWQHWTQLRVENNGTCITFAWQSHCYSKRLSRKDTFPTEGFGIHLVISNIQVMHTCLFVILNAFQNWQSLLVLIVLHDKETWRWWNMPVSLDLDHQHSALADWDDQLHPAESIRWGSPTHVSSSQCNCKLLPNKGRKSIKYIYIYYIYIIYILYMYV